MSKYVRNEKTKMFLWEGESTLVLITEGKNDIGKPSSLEQTESRTINKINAKFQCLTLSSNSP